MLPWPPKTERCHDKPSPSWSEVRKRLQLDRERLRGLSEEMGVFPLGILALHPSYQTLRNDAVLV
jgi:hypothetical protein